MRPSCLLFIVFGCVLSSLSACSTPGAFFTETEGAAFTEYQLSDPNHVLVYFYRPQSEWAEQELEAPGLFLNNELIGSLPSNAYMAFEFDPVTYQMEMRRPLMGSYWTLFADGPLDFARIASFALDAQTGTRYFLRYDELNPPPSQSDMPAMGDGPVQLVSEQVALEEIPNTHEVQALRKVESQVPEERAQRGFWRGVGESLESIGI